jgi:hypothetical protein
VIKRWALTVGLAVVCAARLGADVTIRTTTSIEGGMAAMGGGGTVTPTVVTRIKGDKARTDVDAGPNSVVTLVDLATGRAMLLLPKQKTAQVLDPAAAGALPPDMPMPKVDTSLKATGQTRTIAGATCAEYAVTMKMDMSTMAGAGKMPPEAAAALKDLRVNMSGSVWVANEGPGAAEYARYQAGAAKLALGALSAGGTRSMPSGMEQLITGFKDAPGIPYLTELTMAIEGSGKMAEMMKGMGAMKIISRVTSVTTEGLEDALFDVPADYKLVKQ